MCKNLMVVGIKPNKQDEINKFMIAMAPIMSDRDQDGVGYAAMTEQGLYGERWLNPKDAFVYRKPWTNKDQALKDEFHGTLEGERRYNFFMDTPKCNLSPMIALIMHARFATCEKGLKNVHPFYQKGTAMIHNGVISNTKDLKQITSTCDSECILNEYLERKVATDPDKISEVSAALRGSYTCGVLTKTADGTPVLDLFRSSPYLYACYIHELDALVFCTSSQMVVEACKELGWRTGNFFRLKDDDMLRIDARTGRFLSSHKFRSTATSYPSHYSSDYSGYDNGEFGEFGHGGYSRTSKTSGTVAGNTDIVVAPISDSGSNAESSVQDKQTPPELSQEAVEMVRTGIEKKRANLKSTSTFSPKTMEFQKLTTSGTGGKLAKDKALMAGLKLKH